MTFCLLACGPLVVMLAAWANLYRSRQRPPTVMLVALGVVSANAVLAAGTYLYSQVRPSPSSLPPWEDLQVLNFGLLFLLAPVGMIVGAVAAARGGNPKSLIYLLELASLPLLVLGFFATLAV